MQWGLYQFCSLVKQSLIRGVLKTRGCPCIATKFRLTASYFLCFAKER
jgi:hypothetical protein